MEIYTLIYSDENENVAHYPSGQSLSDPHWESGFIYEPANLECVEKQSKIITKRNLTN